MLSRKTSIPTTTNCEFLWLPGKLIGTKLNSDLERNRFTFEVCSRRCHLTLEVMQKQTLSEDELIGSNELDISKLLENQVTELDVPLEREGERVGSVRLRIVFEFSPQVFMPLFLV